MAAPQDKFDWQWHVIDQYFRERGMVQHQLDSYNEFIKYGLARIVREMDRIIMRADKLDKMVDITMKEVRICTPQYTECDGQVENLTPYIARLKSMNYDMPIFVGMNFKYIENGAVLKDEDYIVQLCRMPVMLHSDYCYLTVNKDVPLNKLGECAYDVGGYFIINGNEKVLIAQERLCNNMLFITRDPKGALCAEIRSCIDSTNRTTCTLYVKLVPPKIQTGHCNIRVTVPYVKEDMPALLVLKAFGLSTDHDIYRAIALNRPNLPIIQDYVRFACREHASWNTESVLEHMGKFGTMQNNSKERRILYSVQTLTKEVFPNMGLEESDNLAKAHYLGYVIHQLLCIYGGHRDVDDRDDYRNKRIDMAGTLLSQLFRQLLNRTIKDTKNQMKRRLNESKQTVLCLNIQNIFNSNIITKGLSYALSTGNWSATKTLNKNKVGVSQILHRMTFSSMISHLRRLSTPLGREGKTTRPRQLHNTQWFTVCPSETPEGQACGLVKNFSLMAHISGDSSHIDMVQIVSDITKIKPMHAEGVPGEYIVLHNGCTLGYVDAAARVAIELRRMRRCGALPCDVSIVLDNQKHELRIHTDQGRLSRPAFVLYTNERGKKYVNIERDKTWKEYLKCGAIEYLDHDEESWCLIATCPDLDALDDYDYTHCEMHPSMILGVCASIIPFANHNQSPRNCYQSSMGKQALGVSALNFDQRYDAISHVLLNPQKPLVLTRAMDYMFFRELPAGVNAIVAIACYSGQNQEDSIVINKAAVDRGLFRSIAYKSYKDEEKRHNAVMVSEFDKPQAGKCIGMHASSYEHIQSDGLVAPGARLCGGDVVVGKTMPTGSTFDAVSMKKRAATDVARKDDSQCIKHSESGIVDNVMLTNNHDGLKFARIRIRSLRIPKLGDKLCIPVTDEILTDAGWVALADIDINKHRVATLIDGEHLAFVHPSYKYIYDHRGPMYEYKSNSMHILCTLNHRLYVKYGGKYQFMEAQDVYGLSVRFKHNAVCDETKRAPARETLNRLTRPIDANTRHFHTDDLDYANNLVLIALYAGWAAHIIDGNARPRIEFERARNCNSSVCATNRRYTLVVHMEDAQTPRNHCTLDSLYTEQFITEYQGQVGCLEMSSTQIFYTRRDKWCLPYWTGNSSRAAQKGTIGLVMPHEDMPFTRDGITPDIIINPHCMMRMTIGQILEMVLGKVCCYNGLEGDGTAFNETDTNALCAALKEHGFQPHGSEVLYSGMTGKRLEAKIFIGPAYYQRLKHMVDDKIFQRSRGPVTALTRQALEGRSRGGGLRVGEMERDCLIAHGSAMFLRERLFISADRFSVHVCNQCGLMCSGNTKMAKYECKHCENTTEVSEIPMPYVAKLLFHELMAMNIFPRMKH